jgi:hypothetical protein
MPITFNSQGGFLNGTISSSNGDIFITTSGSAGNITIGNLKLTGSVVQEADSDGVVRLKKTFNSDGSILEERFNATGIKTSQTTKTITGIETIQSASATSNQMQFIQNSNTSTIILSGSDPRLSIQRTAGANGWQSSRRAQRNFFLSASIKFAHGLSSQGDYYFSPADSAAGINDAVLFENNPPFFMISQSGDVVIKGGKLIAEEYVVSSSVTEVTTLAQSGSTKFGDTVSDDTHQFTGSILITGSLTTDSIDINGGTLDNITSLTFANNIDVGNVTLRAQNILADARTSGRVAFYTTNGALSDDSDLTFSGDTLSATQISSTNITASGNISASGVITGENIQLASKLSHIGDENTFLRFKTDEIELFANNIETSFNKGHISASGNISGSGTGSFTGGGDFDGRVNINSSFAQLRLSDDNFSDFLAIGQEGTVGYIKTSDADNNFKIRRGSDNTDLLSIDFSDNQILLSGSVTSSGDLLVQSQNIFIGGGGGTDEVKLIHNGDTDTHLLFDANKVNLVAGGSSAIKLETSTGKITINNTNSNLDTQIMGDNGEVILHTDAGMNSVGINTIVPITGSTAGLTVEGGISASGIVYMDSASIGGGIFTSASLAAGGGGGSMDSFTLTADGGSNQTIEDGNTLDIAGGTNITTAVGATDTVTVNLDTSPSITNLTASGNISASGTIESTGNISTDGSITATSADINGAVDIDGGDLTVGTGIQLTNSGVINFGTSLDNGRITWGDEFASLYGKSATTKLRLGSMNVQGVLTISSSHENTMVISGSNVGIGTTSPTTELEVVGDISASGTISSTGTYQARIHHGSTAGPRLELGSGADPDSFMSIEASGGKNKIETTTRDFHLFGTNTTTGFYLDEGLGNFGIKTIVPSASLDVNGNLQVQSHITASGNISASGELSANTVIVGSTISHIGDTNTLISFGTDTLTFKAGNESFITITEDGSQDNIVIGDGGDIDFHVKAGGDNTLFVQGSSQRVGIGTATPNMKLSVDGDISASGMFITSSTGLVLERAGHEKVALQVANSDRFQIRNQNDNRNDLVILDDGKFGIGGIDAPTEQLHISGAGDTKLFVEGDISSSGDINAATATLGGFTIDANDATISRDLTIGRSLVHDGDADTGVFFDTEKITAVADSIVLDGNITASNNISASGTIFANDFQSATGGSGIDFNDDVDISGSLDVGGDLTTRGFVNQSSSVYIPQSEFFDVANSKFVCLISGSNGQVDADVVYGTFEDNTTISILGTGSSVDVTRPLKETIFIENKYSSGSIAAASLNFGDIIEADKPITIVESNTTGAKGKEGNPLNFASKTFLTYGDRNHPVQVMMYSPFAAGSVTMSVENVGSDNPGGGTFVPFISASIEADGTLDLRSSGSDDSGNIATLIQSTVPIVAQSVATRDNDNDDATVLMPLDSVILNVDSDSDRKLRLDSTITSKTFTATTSSHAPTADVNADGNTPASKSSMKVFTSSNAALTQYMLTGDGNGSDAVMGIGTNTIGDTYIIPHAVGGLGILSTEPAIISCSQMNNDGTLSFLFAVDHRSASISAPLGFQTGSTMNGYSATATGSDHISASLSPKGLYIEGTGNFGLRTNTRGHDEYTPLGYRRNENTNFNKSVKYYFKSDTVVNEKAIFNTITASGVIKAATLDAAAVSDTLAAAIVSEIDNDEIPIAKLAEDAVTITAGDGLKTGGSVTLGDSVTLDIDASDFAGTGLSADGSENLNVDAAQTQITSVGALSSLTVAGDMSVTSSLFKGDITASGNISGSGASTGSFGKVTIGTATPANSHVQLTAKGGNGGNAIAHFERTLGGTGTIKISANASEPQINFKADNDNERMNIGVERAGGAFVIASGSSIADKEIVVVTQDNKVGINTTSPTKALQVAGDISSSGTITGLSGSFSNLDVLDNDAGANPRFRVGRNTSENIAFSVIDLDTTITADQDNDSNGAHNFILNRTFDGIGESKFSIQKGGTDQFVIGVSGSITASGNISASGIITANVMTAEQITSTDDMNVTDDLIVGGNISASGTVFTNEIDAPSGDITIDSAGDIILDADGTDIILKDDGTSFGSFKRASSDFIIKAETADKDILFKGTDGSSTITALTLDMSEAGAATFNSDITAGGDVSASGFIKTKGVNITDSGNASFISQSGTSAGFSNQIFIGDVSDVGGSGFLKIFNNDGDEVEKAHFSGMDVGINTVPATNMELTVAGDISASGTVFAGTGSFGEVAGTLTTAAQGNITSLGTLTTLTVDDITISGSKISDSGNFTLDVGGDITLDAAGDQIYFKDAGSTRFTFNLDSTPEIDVAGDFTIDGSGLIKLDSATNIVDLVGNVTASGNISASGDVESKTLNVNTSAELTGSVSTTGPFNIHYGIDGTATGSLSNGQGYGEIISIGAIHSSVSAGDICFNVNNVWRQTDADIVGSSGDVWLGVALADGGGSKGPILLRGIVRLGAGHITDSSGQNGDSLFISTTAGHVQFAAPSGNGDVVRIVGYCVNEDDDIIYFNPSATFVEVSA